MFKFLIVIFFFFIILMALAGFSVIRMFKNFLFGSPDDVKRAEADKKRKMQQQRREQEQAQQRNARKKVFAEDDGEYVDYEEIK